MHKFLLMSLLLATALIPALASRDKAPRRGLRKTIVGMLVFNFLYLLAVTIIYPRICW